MGEGVARATTNATDCRRACRVVAAGVMLTLATISAILLATAAVIRSFRAVENQALLAIRTGKELWVEVSPYLKKLFSVAQNPHGRVLACNKT
jgi:hypothetical protein